MINCNSNSNLIFDDFFLNNLVLLYNNEKHLIELEEENI
jgi:hypothetical protein